MNRVGGKRQPVSGNRISENMGLYPQPSQWNSKKKVGEITRAWDGNGIRTSHDANNNQSNGGKKRGIPYDSSQPNQDRDLSPRRKFKKD